MSSSLGRADLGVCGAAVLSLLEPHINKSGIMCIVFDFLQVQQWTTRQDHNHEITFS